MLSSEVKNLEGVIKSKIDNLNKIFSKSHQVIEENYLSLIERKRASNNRISESFKEASQFINESS
jgi:hypothetical protein